MTRTLIALSLSLAALPLVAPSWSGDEVTWETSLDRAVRLARADGKPMLVVFRCPP